MHITESLCHTLETNMVNPWLEGSLLAVQEIWIQYLGQKDPLEKGMTTQSSIFAWRIP